MSTRLQESERVEGRKDFWILGFNSTWSWSKQRTNVEFSKENNTGYRWINGRNRKLFWNQRWWYWKIEFTGMKYTKDQVRKKKKGLTD